MNNNMFSRDMSVRDEYDHAQDAVLGDAADNDSDDMDSPTSLKYKLGSPKKEITKQLVLFACI